MLDQYSNRHLLEVNCGFQFPQETVSWDSTFFGQFYDKIKGLGFTEKQERKGVQITFNPTDNGKQTSIASSEVEDNVVFMNSSKGQAITMGKNKISFHVIKGYTNWGNFINDVVFPNFTIYKELGLGNGTKQCSIVYLNRFVKPTTDILSDYFTFISPLEANFGGEINTVVQRIVQNDANLLVVKLNTQVLPEGRNIVLECGAICNSLNCMNGDWLTQANQTHAPIKDFFESLITEKLRAEL